jgi:hypothetical protein
MEYRAAKVSNNSAGARGAGTGFKSRRCNRSLCADAHLMALMIFVSSRVRAGSCFYGARLLEAAINCVANFVN